MGAAAHDNLQKQVQEYCQKNKTRRKQESHRTALEGLRRHKEQQKQRQTQEEQEASYSQMLQDFEWTQGVMRGTISRASTISDKDFRMKITEGDFIIVQQKIDRIVQKLSDLYGNWQDEYRNMVTQEDCDEVKKFYKPLLDKYKSKYRI